LFYFVSDKIRYLGLVETDVEGYKPHKAEIVLKHMEGVCKDKAGLLVSLLRAAGFNAYYAITGAGIRKDRKSLWQEKKVIF
jgi:transglutaminase-like putative cysteine protease